MVEETHRPGILVKDVDEDAVIVVHVLGSASQMIGNHLCQKKPQSGIDTGAEWTVYEYPFLSGLV